MGLDDKKRSFIPRWKRGRFSLLVNGGGAVPATLLCLLYECAAATAARGRQGAGGCCHPCLHFHEPQPAPWLCPAACAAGVSPTAAYLVDHTTRTCAPTQALCPARLPGLQRLPGLPPAAAAPALATCCCCPLAPPPPSRLRPVPRAQGAPAGHRRRGGRLLLGKRAGQHPGLPVPPVVCAAAPVVLAAHAIAAPPFPAPARPRPARWPT